MPRKSVATPAVIVPEKPSQQIPVPHPKMEVKGEGTRDADWKTSNELVVQKVVVPCVFNSRGKQTVEFKDFIRIFIRPDESHDATDARWDEHEPEDENALKQLFATYGKGHGTTISIRHNVTATGDDEFFLDVRHPKPDQDNDEKFPSVLIDLKNPISDLVADLFYEMSGEDPGDDFKTRGALETQIEEMKEETEELGPIRDVLNEFDMPGDLPAHLYPLQDRLRSIFRTAKGLGK